ncbi:MAG: DUF3084 domain-containing protein [Armatimonadetes bacterium]|nr:DUF3084 domain-containing protein [Armatimonadota bacterium]NIM24215.1 DUF3084 domain-containing protein [Armatimonadota bacterium]NIM68084.1 DUF3084 domain-containing protein [Armatimonadota bacterium]NIM76546.1 DUF3084 domain-containing protein [Armatimonadota bacterium]NIN06289.1 DUF3084 domain-containing protein [Armatimonadota bacterium]
MKGTYGFFLVLVLVLVSGLIAYLGDVLGRRLGRRRITLFGLRPRYTAIAFSVLAGMMITLITLIAAAALSEKVRVGLTQVDEMRSQMSALGSKLEESLSTLAAAEERTKKIEDAREAALLDLADTKRKMDEVSVKLEEADAKLKSVNEELENVTARLSQSQERLQKVQEQLTAARAELKRGERLALGQGRRLLEMEGQRDELASQRDALTKEVRGLKKQAKLLRQERDGLKTEVARLNARLDALVGATTPILTEEVIFEVGEELGRKRIEANQPITALRRQLQQFVHSLETRARQAGAAEDENGRVVIPTRILTQPGNGQIRIYEDSEVMEMLARQIHAPSGSVIVRAFCLLNVPRGLPVPVNLTLTPNHLLFKQGEQLGSTTLNPRKSEGELLAEIVGWLREDISTRARQKEILPDLPSPGEKALLFGTSRYSVGRISPDKIFGIIREIKRRRSSVEIVARAAKDTWTVGPLELELAIERR